MKPLIKVIIVLSLFLGGCSFFQTKPNLPTVLTSKDMQWTIPAGVEFQAIQKPAYPKLSKFIVTDDLAVIYKGNLLELEQEANTRVIKASREGKKQGAIWGSISGILSLLGAIFAKNKLSKKKERK